MNQQVNKHELSQYELIWCFIGGGGCGWGMVGVFSLFGNTGLETREQMQEHTQLSPKHKFVARYQVTVTYLLIVESSST